jgi:O-antigen ligase
MVLRQTSLQNLFLFVLALCVSLNASNTNVLIQISSINFIILFFLCLKNKQVLEAIKINYSNNKVFFVIFFAYVSYLVFQIVPLPLHWFEIIAPANHALYSSIKIDKEFWSLSLDPSSSYFRILNVINFFIIFLVFPALFFKSRHLMKVMFFLSLLGFCHAVFATYWMLIGNPSNFLIQKIHYLHASTGLFVNRAVFATFLVLCAFSALYYMAIFFQKNKITNFGLFEQINTKIIYLRIFIIFLTIGILTTWSRIANFSYVLVLISFLIYSKVSFKKYINPLSTIILFILTFDILVLGLIFGNAKLIARYAETSLVNEALRLEFYELGLIQFKKFWLFGYGSGAFEIVYKLFSTGKGGIATHAHHEGIELMGEVGILGILILFLLSIMYFKKLVNNIHDDRVLARFFLISSLLLILFIQSFVDYSLHIPGISTLLAVILSVGLVNFRKANP